MSEVERMLSSSSQCSDLTQQLPGWFHDYISISDYNLFRNAMTDITGKISLSLDDPRYLHLLNLDIVPCLMILHHYNPSSTLFTYYLHRWRQNNPSTKNLITLMEIIIKRFNLCITSANRRLGQNQIHLSTKHVKQCCNGLFFVIMMIQYLTLTVDSDEEMRSQLLVHCNWPEDGSTSSAAVGVRNTYISPGKGSSNSDANGEGIPVFERLIGNCVTIISVPAHEENPGLSDIKLFAVEFLVVMNCSEVYKNLSSSPTAGQLLRQFLFRRYGSELQKTLSSRILSSLFLESHAVKLVKGLVQQALCSDYEAAEGDFVKHMRTTWRKYQQRYNENLKANSSTLPLYHTVANWFSIFQLLWSTSEPPPTANATNSQFQKPKTQKTKDSQNIENGLHSLGLYQNFPVEEGNLLPQRSTQLLLLMIHQRRLQNVLVYNPFREAFNLLIDATMAKGDASDEDSDIEVLDGSGHHGNLRGKNAFLASHIHIDFEIVFDSLIRNLPNPNYILLFYSFMQMHTTFVELLRASDCVIPILLKCLQGLYETSQSNLTRRNQERDDSIKISSENNAKAEPFSSGKDEGSIRDTYEPINQLYTLLISVLLMVQDPLLVNSAALYTIVDCPWYGRERQPGDQKSSSRRAAETRGRGDKAMPLVDLIVTVMIKACTNAMFRLKDQYMLSNIYAVLMNLVPTITNLTSATETTESHSVALSPTICERLVKTIISLCKRANKEYEKFNQAMQLCVTVDSLTAMDGDLESVSHRVGLSPSSADLTFGEEPSPVGIRDQNISLGSLSSGTHFARSISDSTIAYEESSGLWSTYSTLSHNDKETEAVKNQQYHLMMEEREAITNRHAETLALIRMGLKHLIDFAASILKVNMSKNTNLLYAILLEYISLSKCLSMELIQTLLIDDSMNSEDETLTMTVHHKYTKDSRYLLNLGKYFLRLFADEEAEKGEIVEGKSRAYRYYTAVEAMEELTLQVKLLENEIDIQVQQGLLDRHLDLYELFASDGFSCIFDWNAIRSKKRTVSNGNVAYDGHNEITQRMQFMYKESDNPDEFFLPYIWSTLMIASPEMLWRLDKAQFSK